jgi:peptidoglycan/xylan/chitin deacetylase (PgdA/CDA1 family)
MINKKDFAVIGFLFSAMLAHGQGYPASPGSVYQDFQDTSNWVSYNGTVSGDTQNVMIGTQSLMLTAVPGSDAQMQKTINTDFTNVNTITVWVYANYPVNSDGWHAASIYLTNDNYQDYFLATTEQLHPGWSKLTFSKNDFVAYGNPTWGPMNNIELGLFGDTSQGMSVSWADMEFNSYSRPKVVICFDDDYTSSYSYGYQYMKKYGFKGTEFVISSTVNGLGRTTTANLNEMYNYGWDMCNHTNTHPDLRTLTQAGVVSEYQICENFLIANGWTRNKGYLHLAYPYGDFNSTVLAADQQFGLLTARTTMESLPQASRLDSRYMLYSQVPDSLTQNVSDILASVNQVVSDGGSLILTFHNLTTTPQVAIDWNVSDFQTIIDAIAKYQKAGSLDVMTLTQWYNGMQAYPDLSYYQANAPQSTAGIPNSGLVYTGAPASAPQTVYVSSNSNLVTFPPSAVFGTGATKTTFPINSTWTSAPTPVTMYVTMNGLTLSRPFTLLPIVPNAINLDASSMTGGSSTNGHVYLSGPAPSGGAVVTLSTNNGSVTLSPSTVTIPAGWFHQDFVIQTSAVPVATPVTITATYNGGSFSATLTVNPASPKKK